MIYAYRTDVGKRASNQDSLYIPSDGAKPVVMVADGMGGHRAGDVASVLALESAIGYIERCSPRVRIQTMMQHAVGYANDKVLEAGRSEEFEGMGTTMVLAYLEPEAFCCANIGDSRLYHYDGKTLTQVTEDHSLVAELVKEGVITEAQAAVHPYKNVLTRAVGTDEFAKADVTVRAWKQGDILMLCTDGLHGVVPDEEMLTVLRENDNKDLYHCCDVLVELASQHDSRDNITVVLVKNDCNYDDISRPNNRDSSYKCPTEGTGRDD